MRRIEREDLRHHIFGTIKAMRSGKGGKGRHPIEELRDDSRISELAGKILDLVDGDSRMVIITEMKQNSYGSRNKWGIDEPWPEGCEPGANDPPPPPRIT